MITAPQRACMLVIEAEIDRSGAPPSVREIAKRLRHRSASQASALLKGLEERGLIRRAGHRSRTLEVLRPVSRFAFYRFDDEAKCLRPCASPSNAETAHR